MGSIDGLKEQVEELKQRLNDPGSQKASEPGELKTRLASIKASLESKQGEIVQLLAEKKRLAAENERIGAEKQQLSAENDQLRKMLKEVLSALDGQPADASTNILSEFLAETDPLVKTNGEGGESVIAAGPPADLATAGPAKAEKAQSGPPGAAAKAADKQTAKQQDPDSGGEEADEEESPALRRIMKRGRRAAG
jgi:DNA repair exonuclease SbcCD ATPase subunit